MQTPSSMKGLVHRSRVTAAKPALPQPWHHASHRHQRCTHRSSAPSVQAAASHTHTHELADAKAALLDAVFGTSRGSRASREERGHIEELQVAVERFQGTSELDYQRLGGLWQLQYTTAADVLPIVGLEESVQSSLLGLPSPLQVGNVYQRFTSPTDGAGLVDNVIQLSVPPLLEDKQGVTITVHASYEVRSGHRIVLAFDGAEVSQVRISPLLEALITPALLPRTPLQHRLLLGIKELKLEVPFRSAAQVVAGIATGSSVTSGNRRVPNNGGSYQLTYLDEDMLIGRSSALGGVFIFTRAE